MIKRIVGLLYRLLQGIYKELQMNATLIIVRLCHHWVYTSWVDHSPNHAADIVYLFGWNLWWGRTKIYVKMMKHICGCVINCMINVFCVMLILCSTSWTKLLQDLKHAGFPGKKTLVDGHRGEGNECWVDFIHQAVFHSHLSYALEVWVVNKIHNFSCCKSELALLNWSSRQLLNKKGTWNLPHEHLWGV